MRVIITLVICMHIVYGGSFNPPTLAHQRVHSFLNAELNPDTFTFLPVSTVYHKPGLAANHHRLMMLELTFKGEPGVIISDLEMRDHRFKGTYEALCALETPGEDTAFVIGADHLLGLYRWKQINKLLNRFKLIVLNRNNQPLSTIIRTHPFLSYYQDRLIVFEDFDMAMSASDFRTTKDERVLNDAVANYIREHELYKR